MTIGQRIADKRKELGLSQEALGEQLGLSRQAVYKWEADGALPEIDKLIALSRLFGVSVGWLLGVEEEPVREQPEACGDALTPEQLRMVEEISGRYIEAAARKKPAHRWVWAAAVVTLCLGGWYLHTRMESLSQQNYNIQMEIADIRGDMTRQIGSITGQVESILKDQNSLTADYTVEVAGSDLRNNQVSFVMRSVPKTYVEGTEACFQVDNGQEVKEFPAERQADGAFTGAGEVTLTDKIMVSVVFTDPAGTRSTQLMKTFEWLYQNSIPEVLLWDDFLWGELDDSLVWNLITSGDQYLQLPPSDGRWAEEIEPAEIEEIRVGLFKNGALVAWAEPCEKPVTYTGTGFEGYRFFFLSLWKVPLEEGDVVQAVSVVRDSAGRIIVYPNHGYTPDIESQKLYHFEGEGYTSTVPTAWDYPQDPTGWPLD